jgi:hypothetical protein
MTEEVRDLRDPVLWRLQQAFWREEPTTDLAAVVRRSRTARALTEADLAAARRREPAAVARVYSIYAPELFRMVEEAVGDRRHAEELTGTAFVSAIEACPGSAGRWRPSEAGCSRSPATTSSTSGAGRPARGPGRPRRRRGRGRLSGPLLSCSRG